MSRALMLAAGLALTGLAIAPAAVAQETKLVEAGKAFPFLERFLNLPPQDRTRFKLSYAPVRDGKLARGVKATLVEPTGARIPLTFDADGFFARTPSAAQLAAKAQVAFDVPAGAKLGTTIRFDPLLRPATEYEAGELAATVDETNRVIAKAAGAAAMLAPKMAGIAFPGAGAGRAVFADGHDQLLPLERGAPVFRPDELKGVVRVRLDSPPTRVGFAGKKK